MDRNPARALVMAGGLMCSLTATLALASEWEPARIDKLFVQANQDVYVFKAPAQGGSQEDWRNPDACDNASRAVLRPRQTIDDVVSGVLSYEQAYAALLGAKLNSHSVSLFLEGCVLIGSVTYPLIERVAIL